MYTQIALFRHSQPQMGEVYDCATGKVRLLGARDGPEAIPGSVLGMVGGLGWRRHLAKTTDG